jgi:drug/metabolite transporter (DMT)-like permease
MVSATLAATCWGLATVMSKGALAQVPPIMLLVIQLASSVVFLWTWLLLRGVRLAAIRDAFRIAWLGLLEPGLAYVLALIGLADASAANATLIGSSEAIMIAVLSAVLLRERLSMGFFALSAVALTGLLTALGVGGTMSGGVTGNGLLALGTGVAAIYVVLSGRLMGDRDPILVVACQHLVAGALALLLLPIEIMHGHRFAFEAMPPSIWALAVGSGIVQYALAFSFYLAAMRTIATSVVGAFLYLGPIVGLAGAFVFLGERFSPLQIAGAVLTILALLALSWSHGAKPAPDAAASPRTLRP